MRKARRSTEGQGDIMGLIILLLLTAAMAWGQDRAITTEDADCLKTDGNFICTPTSAVLESPTCDTIDVRYKVEWAQQVIDATYGLLWRGLDALYWEKKQAVRQARRLLAMGTDDFRSVRVWELREVRLDCEVKD